MVEKNILCPCGAHKQYTACCGRYLDKGEVPANAEILMRSRYTAYTLKRENYLLATWHDLSRPTSLNLANDNSVKWLRLVVIEHKQQDNDHANVEFIAYYKNSGRMQKMHEISKFVREDGRWFYVDGVVNS